MWVIIYLEVESKDANPNWDLGVLTRGEIKMIIEL